MKVERALLYVVLAGSIVAPPPPAASQTPAHPPQRPSDATETPGTDGAPAESSAETTPTQSFEDPFEAYEAGEWEDALEGFLDRRAERPEDPAELLNVASTRYQMGDFDEAARTFAAVAATAPPELRQKALYSLGNTAYRQGRLEEAVEHYRKALELDPDDEDSKFNLEFVQQELERRQQQKKPSQQESEPQNGEGQQQDRQNQGQQQNESHQNEKQQNESQQDETQQDESQQDESQHSPQAQQQGAQQGEPQGPDQDGDGLSDRTEREGENPTDPANPDTDGDGLQDGAEDLNANGRVDPHETDPNRKDTDGDGIPDGLEAPGEAAAGASPPPPEGLTKEQALRYLMALEESRPDRKPKDARAAPQGRPSKDW